MSAIPKSWKPSRRDGSSSLYCLIGDCVSQEIAFVGLIKVFVAIVHHGVSISSMVQGLEPAGGQCHRSCPAS